MLKERIKNERTQGICQQVIETTFKQVHLETKPPEQV